MKSFSAEGVKKVLDKAQQQFKDEVIAIEKRTDISDDDKAARIIRLFSSICAGVAVQPIPFADIFILERTVGHGVR